VYRRLRIHIAKRDRRIGLCNLSGRDLATYDPAE